MPRAFRTLAPLVCLALATGTIAQADSIVTNGSFEVTPVSVSTTWDIFDSIAGWKLVRGPKIEVQRNVRGWQSADGDQYLELDGDIDGPGGTLGYEDASSAIYQDLVTEPGQTYLLTFAFSPRPGVADNALEIRWDGTLLGTLRADGSGLSTTNWAYFTYEVSTASAATRLEFGDVSASDSLGTFLDDVTVSAVPEPTSLMLLIGGVMFALRRRP